MHNTNMDNKQVTVLHGMTRAQVEQLAPVIEAMNPKATQPVPGGELVWVVPENIKEWIELMRTTCRR
jgi:hypothetical protein